MFLLMALLLILGGCSEEILKIEQPINENTARTIKVKANVEGNELGTRFAMSQNGFDVNLTWEVNDMIRLVFTDGVNTYQDSTTVTAVTNNGRRAEFNIVIPEEITPPTFNLYGYYGGGPLSTEVGEEAIANLDSETWGSTMPALAQTDVVMLRFAATNLDVNSPEILVGFKHVGSLFKIFIENISLTTLSNITNVEIFTESGVIYAHQNNGTTPVKYDVINDAFVSGSTAFLDKLSFITAAGSDDLATSEVLELWGWFPPSQELSHAWPALKLRLIHDEVTLETSEAKPARTSPTAIGKAFHFYATYNGTELAFSNVYKQKMIDYRDFSQYNTIQIGNQTWMAENLKYYPQEYTIGSPTIGSATQPHYYVYGFDGVTQDPESMQQFTLGGILYNWAAALEGDTGSDTNPSGVQGICPDGWHLPSQAEWQVLIDFVGAADAGVKLKDQRWWLPASTTFTNPFGFSARPGGVRMTNGTYTGINNNGYWITSDIVDAANMRSATISSTGSTVSFISAEKENAGSVRCVKD